MSKKPSFSGPLDKQQWKWVETLLHEVLALEKVSFSDRENPKTVCLHIDSQ